MVPHDKRDRFAEAFFRNLEQQPLGPGVVDDLEGERVARAIARHGHDQAEVLVAIDARLADR
nr:hypothetical protein [Polyangiaceae bacterium]